MPTPSLSEAQTRKKLIDAQLANAGWKRVPYNDKTPFAALDRVAVEEYPTRTGPADYALWAKGQLLGVVEAKKTATAAQEVLAQAKRYSKGLPAVLGEWNGYRAPFLYSSNGGEIWHLDARRAGNLRRELRAFHTPDALLEWFARADDPDFFARLGFDAYGLRPYQIEAVRAFEASAVKGARKLLIAMATGTGKTRAAVALVHRQLESKNVKRVLFLVDRRALAAQTVREFGSFQTPNGRQFPQEYSVFHQQFRREDIEDGPGFDPKVLPESHLVNPDGSHTFVYVSTIQRMAINLFGHGAIFKTGDGENEEADKLDISSHAFDLIIADECHRGYTAQEMGLWRQTIEHFDALKLGLTATPATHTVSLFGKPVYSYTYSQAVDDGYLCDFDAIKISSGVLMEGAILKEGELVKLRDRETGRENDEILEDERQYDSAKIERDITIPDTNRKIVEELYGHAQAHYEQHKRWPKTLIFAANDIGHTSHADQIVQLCREVFGQGDEFAVKITGNANVDRPLQRIREFRNRPNPHIVVTVDMLSTGVDVPALEWIVFLRPVKSRILWEQMLGRGTRRCADIRKTKFTVFDCFDGTLISYFKGATDMEAEPRQSSLSDQQVVENIWQNYERAYHTRVLVKRLQRRAKELSGDGMTQLAAFGVPDGDLSAWAATLPALLQADFVGTMKILRDPNFWDALAQATRAPRQFVVAIEQEDEVSSQVLFRVGGDELRPADYLEKFARYVRDNPDRLAAIEILRERPREWNREALDELRAALQRHFFEENRLRQATKLTSGKALADTISLVKHAANAQSPLFTAAERVEIALGKVRAGRSFSPDAQQWLGRIQAHLIENLSIEIDDFDLPVFAAWGGLNKARRAFSADTLQELVEEFNEALAS